MPRTTEKFHKLYEQLNNEQREAVDAIEGPVMVIAGPGTGKTQILTLRIANILQKTDTRPENILALTFTESAAASMRRRLSEIIGSGAYSVVISTFHGFCNNIISSHPEEFPHIISSNHIAEAEQIKILEGLIQETPLKILRPYGDPFFYVKVINSSINKLKQEGVSTKEFKNLVKEEKEEFAKIDDLYYDKGAHKGKMKGVYQRREKSIKKNEELARIYSGYQEALAEQKLYDYTDMIMEVVRALEENKDLLLTLQETHQYILVDEHQDTNNAQNKILELLADFHENPNLFVVGDEKQAIFRFQGASLENFLYFKNLYKDVRLVALEQNYRSTQPILDSAHSLLKGPKKLVSNQNRSEQKVQVFELSTEEVERYFIAQHIKTRLESGVSSEEIVVLYRDNRDAAPLAHMLERVGVPFVIESSQDLLRDPDIKKILLLLRAVYTFGAQDVAMEALYVDFLNIPVLDAHKIISHTNNARVSIFDVLRSKEQLSKLELENVDAAHVFYKNLEHWVKVGKNEPLANLFEVVMRTSGILSYALGSSNPLEKMERIRLLFDEVRDMTERHKDVSLKDFLAYIDTVEQYGVLLKKSSHTPLVRAVRLMTAHAAKGREFDHVYVVHAYDGRWGNRRRPKKLELLSSVFSRIKHSSLEKTEIDDERRLFYVALTRARESIVVSYAKRGQRKKEQLPTQFLEEIKAELKEHQDPSHYENEFSKSRDIIFRKPILEGVNMKDKEFIQKLFFKRGISVTALNNYLNCPWKYFYTNLLRIPKSPGKHQMYGIAVHGALKDFFDSLKEQMSDKKHLISKFDTYLNRQPFSKQDYDESLEKGHNALGKYYDFYKTSWHTHALNEFPISGILLTEKIRLTGKIDKVEILGDDLKVNVVDYKTGKPKTRGFIEGATKNSNGDYKRQLVFYKLLLDRFDEGRYAMVSGDIDFVEPDEKERFHKERFVITQDETDELQNVIKDAANEIMDLSFWNQNCDDDKCEFCALRSMMAV